MANPDDAVQRLTYSYAEAERLLGVSRIVVRRLVRDGRVRRARLGTRVVLNRDDVERLAAGEHEPVG